VIGLYRFFAASRGSRACMLYHDRIGWRSRFSGMSRLARRFRDRHVRQISAGVILVLLSAESCGRLMVHLTRFSESDLLRTFDARYIIAHTIVSREA